MPSDNGRCESVLMGSPIATGSLAEERVRDLLFGITPLIQAAAFAGVLVVSTFYLAPEQLVLGTRASLVAFATPVIAQFLPYTSRIWDIRPAYFRFLERHLILCFATSAFAAILLLIWGATMFGELRQRYRYLEAIDRAISLVDAEQIGVPQPELLATAFQQIPFRPEVPFILARAVRILSPDDNLGPFHRYMKRFVSAIDREAVVAFKVPSSARRRLSIEQGRSLPLLDPVELMVQYSIEVPESDREAQYA
jgi:hypothetical protein